MGDMADYALGEMMDWDEATLGGFYDDPDNWEDGMTEMWVFSGGGRRKPRGPGPCPRCKKETVKRLNSKTGSHFYGCVGFPKCHGTRDG
ncbi:hypothetical protein [Bremerella sp. P1]|uniref:hypothetical protein n=1 Tax=Bremerella sp. P1 TaxID=3026424 RepID=UPI002367F88B|nr:hypothetical protein [Bremerella sp. P1]WDI44786.1 hypothetical protein PSR63_12655 [Bremerella sp. P1]